MSIKKIRFTPFLFCLMAAWLCTGFMYAQTVTGSITGTVTDSSGAVVPGAHVTARNVDTAVQTQTTTNHAGDYTIRFLPIGTYDVTVEAPGFGAQTVPPFALEVNQTAKIDASLTVGSSKENVEVHGEVAPILDTTDATLASTFTANQLGNLPLNGGNFSQVTEFMPGAVVTDPAAMTSNNAIERETYNSGTPSINGNRGQANNYTLEEADNNEPQNNLIAYNPAVEALGELRVISSNAPATYGNANGGAVIAIFKSGTNQFHGSAYAYLENYHLDANTWSNNFQIPVVPKNPYNQTRFGGTLGGPIWRSKKLFFFGDYYGVRKHSGGLGTASVLTAAMRTGDFSALYTDPSGSVQLYDTQNNFAEFQNNQVPVLNPVVQYLVANPKLYPLPNATPTDGLMASNYQGPQNSFIDNNQYDIKIEWDPGTKNKFTAFYSSGRSYDGTSQLIPALFPSTDDYPSKLGGGNWIHTFSNAIVNEARFGFTRVRWDNSVPSDPSGAFGLKGNSVVGIPFGAQSYDGFSEQSFSPGQVGTNANVQIIRDNTFNYYDNLTWQHGRHLLSIGIQALRYQQNYLNASNFGFLGTMNYNGEYSGEPGVSAGYAPADFVLNRVDNTQLASALGTTGNRQWRTAGYIQDDWQATSRLTINLGLRYEFDEPWIEAHNKTANVIFQDGVPVVEYAGSVPAGAVTGSIVCPTRACYNANYTQFMPRLGFAYQVTPHFVIRGGYGATSFLEGDNANQRLTSSPPFVSGSNVTAPAPTTTTGGTPFTVQDGFDTQNNTIVNPVYSVWPQNQQPAYISEYNLTAEYALTNSLSLSASYLGESGQHLSIYGNANELTLAQYNAISLANVGNTSGTTIVPASAVAPYSSLVGETGTILLTGSGSMMNYNGAQVMLRQRTHHGLEFTLNYTFAKAMTNSPGNFGSSPGTSGADGAYQDFYNSRADYGPSSNDIRHNLTFNGVYAIPVGHVNPILYEIIGGWKLSATLINYTGLPITINGPNNVNQDGTTMYGQARANQYRHFKVIHRTLNNWWGTGPTVVDIVNGVNQCTVIGSDNGVCAYGPEGSTPGALEFGTAAVNSERAPGYRQVDTSLFKDFHIHGEQSIGFRVNFYNIFNIASYSAPNNSINSTTFGQITNVNSPPRQIEFSAHYSF
jgi:hypothetical protein